MDCGNCIEVCPTKAILPIVDPVEEFSRFKFKVVVPSPVLYAQFDAKIHPYIIQLALKELGFDQVMDETRCTPASEKALVNLVQNHQGRFPLISSQCPAVIRLIQVKYPDLAELIVPLDVPREVTAREVRMRLTASMNIDPSDIGIFFIAPCPAKIVSIKQPAEKTRSWFDGAFSIQDIYPLLLPHVKAIAKTFDESLVPADYYFNPGWAALGSVIRSVGKDNWLAVSGLDHVQQIFDDIENSRLQNIDFVEAMACMLSCIGGIFNVENPYIVRNNNKKQRDRYAQYNHMEDPDLEKKLESYYYFMDNPIMPRPIRVIDDDLETSIKRMKEKERIYLKLPQIDCGVCGSPTCRAFSEDVVRGAAEISDCYYFSGGK